MATKKVTTTKQSARTISSAPDLESRRQAFQAAAAGSKKPTKQPRQHPLRHAAITPDQQAIGRRKVVGVMALLIVLLVPLVAFAAYYSWYRSPEKIVADALVNTMSASALTYTATIASPTQQVVRMTGGYDGSRAKVDATVRTKFPGDLSQLNLSLVSDQNDVYFNVPHASAFIGQTMPATQKNLYTLVEPLVKKTVDGKWMYIQPSETSSLASLTGVSSCSVTALRTLMTSGSSRTALANVYLNEPFFGVKHVGTHGDTATYQLTIDQKKFDAFLDAVTRQGKAVPFGNCTQEITAVKHSTLSQSVATLEVDTAKRVLTSATVSTSGQNPLTTTFTPTIAQSVAISVPQNPVRFSDVQTSFYQIVAQALSGQ